MTEQSNRFIFVEDLKGIPPRVQLYIYGAGGRGEEALSTLKSTRSDIKVLGFLDSFSSGTCRGLSVQTLTHYLLHLTKRDDHYILVASEFYASILEALKEIDLNKIFVFIKDTDPPFVSYLPEKEVVSTLSAGRHPLGRIPINTQAQKKPARHWRCVDFSAIYFRPTGLSFCCWLPDLARVAPDTPGAFQRLDKLREQFCKAADINAHPYCASCPSLLQVKENRMPATKLKYLHIDTSITCNLACSYCTVRNYVKHLDYDLTEVLDYIIDNELLAASFSFDWGGAGEPTLNPDFAPVTERLISLGGTGFVYSNCVKYSQIIEKHLSKSLAVICSIDAGTKETYATLRQRDFYNQVWENIHRYISTGGAGLFTAKYIMLAENCDPENINGFVNTCVYTGVKCVTISRDFYTKNADPRIIQGMADLYKLCIRADIKTDFLHSAIPSNEINEVKNLSTL